MASDEHLLALAQAVADCKRVDWETAESSAPTAGERDIIMQFRQLAAVGSAARGSLESWGSLEIRAEIGGGTFGTVYRAWDARLERDVALKLLHDPRAEERLASVFVKEGRLLAQIRHPNIVAVYGADARDGRVGIWMEFVSGRTLKEILEKEGPFGPYEAALIGRDLCRALAAVHERGVLHRDIKAQNVMRESGGRTVLMDFGAGEVASVDPASKSPLVGTPLYLAPEVLAGGAPSARSDLYSLGVLLYYLVSGRFPVAGNSLDEIQRNHLQNKRALLRDVRPDLPAEFVRMVDRATAFDPAARPESAGAMERLIEHALEMRHKTSPVDAGAAFDRRPSPRAAKRGRSRTLWATVATLLVCAALGAFWLGRGRPERTSRVTRNSVAIMPFRNLTATDADSDYFIAGITDDLVAQLAMLRDLRVISGASMLRYRDRMKTETEIGTELGVAAVLDGSVRQSGDRVRLVSRLVDAHTGEQLWSESFERDQKDLFLMQSEVARKIAVALKGELSEPDVTRLAQNRNVNVQAFKLYLKARYYWSLRTEDGFNRSIEVYQQALQLDPKYAIVHAGLADTYTLMGVYGIMPRDRALSLAGDQARTAIELDGNLAEAHASLGYVEKNRFEWRAAEASFKRALELKPAYETAHLWYGTFLTQQGRFPEAIAELKTALSMDPLSFSINGQFAATLLLARRYDEAISQIDRTLAIDPSHPSLHQAMAEAYAFKRDYDRALSELQRASATGPLGGEDQELQGDLGFILVMAGQRDKARAVLDTLTRREREGAPVAAAIATIYGALGQRDRAFEFLSRAHARAESEIGYLKVDPRWDSLREDERFASLLHAVGFDQ